MDCSLPGSSVHGIFPGKNTGVGCHFLLQGNFPTQGLNLSLLCLLHWQVGSLLLAPPGKQSSANISGSFLLLLFLLLKLSSFQALQFLLLLLLLSRFSLV